MCRGVCVHVIVAWLQDLSFSGLGAMAASTSLKLSRMQVALLLCLGLPPILLLEGIMAGSLVLSPFIPFEYLDYMILVWQHSSYTCMQLYPTKIKWMWFEYVLQYYIQEPSVRLNFTSFALHLWPRIHAFDLAAATSHRMRDRPGWSCMGFEIVNLKDSKGILKWFMMYEKNNTKCTD